MILRPASSLDAATLTSHLVHLQQAAYTKLTSAGARAADLVTRWHAHMRYAGQSYDLPVDLGRPFTGELPVDAVSPLVRTFHDLHERRYAYRSEAETVEIVQLRLSVEGEELAYPKPR